MDDELSGYSDTMWRTRGAHDSSTFPKPGLSASFLEWHEAATYRQWCFLMKMLNCVLQIGQSVTSASGCHLGKGISGGLLDLLPRDVEIGDDAAECGCAGGNV